MAWTTPRTWVAGETVTAALMNTHVRDNLSAIGGAWTSYTPTLSQGASADIAKTVNYAKYIAAGKLVICQIKLSATASGSAGSDIKMTLPVTAATSTIAVGSGFYDDGGTIYRAVAYLLDTTTVSLFRTEVTTGSSIGVNPNIAVASGDVLWASIQYEAA